MTNIVLRLYCIVVVVLLVSVVIYKGSQAVSVVPLSVDESKKEDIPPFTFYDLTGRPLTLQHLPKDQTLIFVFFNSECVYCTDKAIQMTYYCEEFASSTVVWVSSQNRNELIEFEKKYNFDHHANFLIARSVDMTNFQKFGIKGVPTLLIYDRSQKLLVKIDDVVKMKTIVKYIRASDSSPSK